MVLMITPSSVTSIAWRWFDLPLLDLDTIASSPVVENYWHRRVEPEGLVPCSFAVVVFVETDERY